MYAYFTRFHLEMTKYEAQSASHQGRCDDDVEYLTCTAKILRQLDKIPPEAIAAELQEYGAWDDVELSDHAQNRRRIVWIAAGNIVEDQ